MAKRLRSVCPQQCLAGEDYIFADAAARTTLNHVQRSHASFHYQAGSWTKPRWMIAKVEGILESFISASGSSRRT